jgi:DNA polymerase-3 subunit gamma/tau
MLGLSDRGATRAILAQILAGDAPGTLAAVRDQYDLGVEPSALIRGLLEAVHGITRSKVGGAGDLALSVEEREAYAEWASRLGHGAIHRLWQLLLKGLNEVVSAPMPLEAAEMALLRVIHAADLPDPGAVLEKLASGEAVAAPAPAAGAPRAEGQGALLQLPASFGALVELLGNKGKAHIAQQLHDYVGLVGYAPPELVVRPLKPLPGDFIRNVAEALKAVTGTGWRVRTADEEAQPSLLDQQKADADRLRQDVLDAPIVKAAFEAFPEAELAGYRTDEQRSA